MERYAGGLGASARVRPNFRDQWPWPSRARPEVFYDPRTLSIDQNQRATWHAKCVLVDDELALVTSANFTEWAHQRNVEAGVFRCATVISRVSSFGNSKDEFRRKK